MALAAFAAPAMAQGAMVGNGGVDILGNGIFESDGSAFQFPLFADTNFDSITVGNDKATAFGTTWGWPYEYGPANAVNNLEIKKNQDSGACDSCCSGCGKCQDACNKINTEMITLGNREAMAFGFSNAANNIKIVTNQV